VGAVAAAVVAPDAVEPRAHRRAWRPASIRMRRVFLLWPPLEPLLHPVRAHLLRRLAQVVVAVVAAEVAVADAVAEVAAPFFRPLDLRVAGAFW
jgi:hypothetical protein